MVKTFCPYNILSIIYFLPGLGVPLNANDFPNGTHNKNNNNICSIFKFFLNLENQYKLRKHHNITLTTTHSIQNTAL